MGSILDLNLENTPPLEVLEDGSEVTVKCISCEIAESKTTPGSMGLKSQHDIEGYPNAARIFHWQGLPSEGDDEGKANGKRRGLVKMLQAHGVSLGDVDDTGENIPALLEGLTAPCVLRYEEAGEFPEKNSIKNWA